MFAVLVLLASIARATLTPSTIAPDTKVPSTSCAVQMDATTTENALSEDAKHKDTTNAEPPLLPAARATKPIIQPTTKNGLNEIMQATFNEIMQATFENEAITTTNANKGATGGDAIHFPIVLQLQSILVLLHICFTANDPDNVIQENSETGCATTRRMIVNPRTGLDHKYHLGPRQAAHKATCTRTQRYMYGLGICDYPRCNRKHEKTAKAMEIIRQAAITAAQ